MFDLTKEFNLIKSYTEKINEAQENLDDIKQDRELYFKDLTHLLNNHREELKEIKGLEGYNYCEPNAGEYNGKFHIVFKYKPTANGLAVIENITGAKFIDMYEHPQSYHYVFMIE